VDTLSMVESQGIADVIAQEELVAHEGQRRLREVYMSNSETRDN
jgi:hypothetical protein